MKVIISGYGKMGKMVEKLCHEYGDEVIGILNSPEDWKKEQNLIESADVIIDFSFPNSAIQNIETAFSLDKPIVVGTTGWHDSLETILKKYDNQNKSMVYGSNFSIGVNIFFQVNKIMANLMAKYGHHKTAIEEIHHTAKLDSPSGTAISLANQIISNNPKYDAWVNEISTTENVLQIISKREADVPGTHIVTYQSEIDKIELVHTAFTREGFARGAILAARLSLNNPGIHDFNDLLFN